MGFTNDKNRDNLCRCCSSKMDVISIQSNSIRICHNCVARIINDYLKFNSCRYFEFEDDGDNSKLDTFEVAAKYLVIIKRQINWLELKERRLKYSLNDYLLSKSNIKVGGDLLKCVRKDQSDNYGVISVFIRKPPFPWPIK